MKGSMPAAAAIGIGHVLGRRKKFRTASYRRTRRYARGRGDNGDRW